MNRKARLREVIVSAIFIASGGIVSAQRQDDSTLAVTSRTITIDSSAVFLTSQNQELLIQVKDSIGEESASFFQLFSNGSIRLGKYADLTHQGLSDGTSFPYIAMPSASFVSGFNSQIINTDFDFNLGNFAIGLSNLIDSCRSSSILGGFANTMYGCEDAAIVASNESMMNQAYKSSIISSSASYMEDVSNSVSLASFSDTIARNGEDSDVNGILMFGGQNSITNNTVAEYNSIVTIHLANNNRITDNNVSATASNLIPGIQYSTLWDNCEVIGNELTGEDVVIWDIHAIENCSVNNNILSGDRAMVDMIILSSHDSVSSNTLSGADVRIMEVFAFGSSSVDNNTLSGDNSEIQRVMLLEGRISDNTLAANNEFKNIQVYNGTIKNGSSQTVENVLLLNRDLDLSSIEGDVDGYFAFGGDVDIDGGLKFVDGNEAAGFVLTSNAEGIATWTEPQTGGVSYSSSTYTLESPFTVPGSTVTKLPFFWTSSPANTLPTGVDSLFSRADTTIIGKDGRLIDIMLNFKGKATENNQWVDIWLELGDAIGQIFKQTFSMPKGSGAEHGFVFSLASVRNNSAWATSGAGIFLESSHDLNIYDLDLNIDVD